MKEGRVLQLGAQSQRVCVSASVSGQCSHSLHYFDCTLTEEQKQLTTRYFCYSFLTATGYSRRQAHSSLCLQQEVSMCVCVC